MDRLITDLLLYSNRLPANQLLNRLEDNALSVDTDTDSDMSDQPELSIFVEEGELSDQDPDVTVTDPDQTLSEEQTYRETMRGIRSFMGWTHIPNMDTATSTSDDNPFEGPKLQPAHKVLVKMPTDE